MFENAGAKIKAFAKVWFVILLLAAVGGAIALRESQDIGMGVILVMGGGFLVAWISCLFIYGFGEIVEHVEESRVSQSTGMPQFTKRCPECGEKVGMYDRNCAACGCALSTVSTAPLLDGWRCTCGKMNPKYLSTCSCGKSAREVREGAVATTLSVDDAIQQEVRQLSVEELQQRYQQKLQWSKKYRDLCGEELRNRGYYT